jgi:hypothetical protein
MIMKKVVLMAIMIATGMCATAQESVETAISADVVNDYIWRGQKLGNVAIQPTLGVSYKGLALTAWGSVGLANTDDTKEFDFTLSYTLGGLNIGVTDYWFNQGGLDPEGRYFKYDAHGTNHVFEGNIGYDFGFAALQWYTNFSGNDYKADGKRAYSSYMEVTVPFKLSAVEWTATAGAVPYESVQYGTSGFAVTNLALKATKDIKVTDTFSVPVFAQVVANPCAQMSYLVIGFTLQP